MDNNQLDLTVRMLKQGNPAFADVNLGRAVLYFGPTSNEGDLNDSPRWKEAHICSLDSESCLSSSHRAAITNMKAPKEGMPDIKLIAKHVLFPDKSTLYLHTVDVQKSLADDNDEINYVNRSMMQLSDIGKCQSLREYQELSKAKRELAVQQEGAQVQRTVAARAGM